MTTRSQSRWIDGARSGTLALLLTACATHGVNTPSEPLAPKPKALPYDVVDGYVVVATRFETQEPTAGVEFFDLSGPAPEQVDWIVESGQVSIVNDPFSGETLFRPQGAEPAMVRPSVDGVVGEPINVGIAPEFVDPSERHFYAAGGGACAANPNHSALFALVGNEFTVDVRSVVNTSVQPLSASERTLVYQHAQYHAWSPEAGPMRIRFNPDYISRTTLSSLAAPASPDDPFFPASAETNLHFIIDFLDHGISVFNKEPMRLRSQSTQWPPFRVPQVNESGDVTEFYMVGQPDVLMLTIQSQEQYVYPTSEIGVRTEGYEIDGTGLLHATFEVENESELSGRIRWFVVGNYGQAESPREGVVELAPGGKEQVVISTRPAKRLLTQFITLGAVSETDERLTGSTRLEFRYPEATPLREKLLSP